MATSSHTLSPKQQAAIARSTGRVSIYEGSVRAGKTFASIIRWLTIMADPPTGGEYVMIGKNLDSIYRNIFAPLANEPALAWAAPYITYRQGSTVAHILGRRINIIGANDKSTAAKIQGMTVAAAYADELSLLDETFFTMLLSRMSPPGAILIGTTNPDSPRHWLKRRYLDRVDELDDWRRFHFTMDDNMALSEEYKTAIKNEYEGIWYDRYILGKWTAAEGAIFSGWDEQAHTVAPEKIPPLLDLYAVGVDYGTTNPTAAVALARASDNNLYLIDEWRVDQNNRTRQQTDAELARGLQDWLAQLPAQPRFVIVDPSAASFRAQLLQDGQPTMPGNNAVVPGIRTLASLLTAGRLKVSTACTGLIDEIPGYVWDPKATAEGRDAPLAVDDHSIDAARYALHGTRALWQSAINPST